MKKLGIIFILTGIVLFLIFSYVGNKYGLSAIQYSLASLGLIVCFLGISFLFLNESKTKRFKASLIILLVSLTVFIFSLVSNYFHWIFANVERGLSVILFCFSYLPIIVKNRYEKWSGFSTSKIQTIILSLGDFLGAIFILMGLLFKTLHWRGASFALSMGAIIFVIVLFAWNQLFKKEVKLRKLAEDKIKETLDQIQKQHKIVEEKNNEIVDSINYAKRLQTAILPTKKTIDSNFEHSFILYLPKDIVAGDFYWTQRVGETTMFAVADCTGHGVPGAIVSVVCSNALNRAVKEFGNLDPGKILDKTRELVIETFEKSDLDVKDGMDISLLVIKDNVVLWSGANNPLWYISDNKFYEIKANKQPIGKHLHQEPFITHSLEKKSGDIFYLFTDGYADQFGGPKEKKFKYKQFESVLLKIFNSPLEIQKSQLENIYMNWKGSLDQIDDVCVVGIRML